jgi:hypothetical protein
VVVVVLEAAPSDVVVVVAGATVEVVVDRGGIVVVVVEGTVEVVVDRGGVVVVVVGGCVVVVVVDATTMPGRMPPGLLVVTVVVTVVLGGYRYPSVPNPMKATTIRTVERRTGTEREIGKAMKPTRRLCGIGSSTRGVLPVVGSPEASQSVVSPSLPSCPDASSLTGCLPLRGRRLRVT